MTSRVSTLRKIWNAQVVHLLQPQETGCVHFLGSHTPKGYPTVSAFVDGRGQSYRLNRLTLELKLGRRLGALCALHRCDNPGCVNREHLFAGTPNDNRKDAIAKGRAVFGTKGSTSGEKHARARLTANDVLQIRELFASKVATALQLAARFSVNEFHIYNVIRRRRWKHI